MFVSTPLGWNRQRFARRLSESDRWPRSCRFPLPKSSVWWWRLLDFLCSRGACMLISVRNPAGSRQIRKARFRARTLRGSSFCPFDDRSGVVYYLRLLWALSACCTCSECRVRGLQVMIATAWTAMCWNWTPTHHGQTPATSCSGQGCCMWSVK